MPPKGRTTPLHREVARSVDAPPSLIPVLADLLKDIPNLGSTPIRTSNLLARAGLKPGARVLDLACGKGTLAIRLARAHQCRVTAVDAFEPFLTEATHAASRQGLSELIDFVLADVHAFVETCPNDFDAALMMGLDPIDEAGPMLRDLVRPGGLYAIDDVFRDDAFTPAPRNLDMSSVPTREDCHALIQQWGDDVVALDVPTPSQIRALNDGLYESLKANAALVAKANPALRPAIAEFLKNQRDANKLLGGPLRPAVWIVRRNRS
jgi:SAM-dependent methyltransferase